MPLRKVSFPVKLLLDTTGAGECFTAGFTVAMLSVMNESDRLRFAYPGAGHCVRRQGAVQRHGAMPSRAELQALMGLHE